MLRHKRLFPDLAPDLADAVAPGFIAWASDSTSDSGSRADGELNRDFHHDMVRLRESEARYRELIEQAPDAIFIANGDGCYIDVNAAACRLLGYSRGELIGKSIVDLIPAFDCDRLEQSKQIMMTGRAHVAEWTLLRKDGSRVPVEVSASITTDGRWQGFVRDITERKRTERALRRSEESSARAERIAHLGVWEWDLRTNEVTRSCELSNLLGIELNEHAEHADDRLMLSDFIHPDDRERVMTIVTEAACDGRNYAVEHRLLRTDGSDCTVLHQGEVSFEAGVPARIVATMLDITIQRELEREREEIARWLLTVVEQCPVGIVLILGKTGERVVANRCAERLFGRKIVPNAGIQQYASAMHFPNGEQCPLDDLPGMQAIRGETLDGMELLLENTNGTRIPIVVNAAPFLNPDGQIEGAILAFDDISAQKNLERLRAEWNSIVAHDLRQPVNTIRLSSRYLLRKVEKEPELNESVQQILRSVTRLNRMIQDLLDLSRLEVRQLPLARQLINITTLVTASVERIRLEAPDRSYELVHQGEPSVLLIDGDRITQVVENLLTNAVKYGHKTSPIGITTKSDPRVVEVSVTSKGAVIASEDLPHLFDRFHRTGAARQTGIPGIGLGLYIARELIEAHGGKITAESTASGMTTFRFSLPVAGVNENTQAGAVRAL